MKGQPNTKADDLNSKDSGVTALQNERQQLRDETLTWISVFALSKLRLAWRRKQGPYRYFDSTDQRT